MHIYRMRRSLLSWISIVMGILLTPNSLNTLRTRRPITGRICTRCTPALMHRDTR